MIDPQALDTALASCRNKWTVECLDCVDSTNLELGRRFSGAGTVSHFLLWAEEQTEGRGRLQRRWLSIPGADITVSVCFPAPVERTDIPKLSLCAGLALVSVVASRFGIEAQARWPNDVVTPKGKLAGILSSYLPTPNAVVCGIGINVNSQPDSITLEEARRRTTLLAELGREVAREALTGSWVAAFENLWPLAEVKRFRDLKTEFDSVSFYRDRKVRILKGAQARRDTASGCEEFEGTARSINTDGSLLVDLADGGTYEVSIEDVLIPLE